MDFSKGFSRGSGQAIRGSCFRDIGPSDRDRRERYAQCAKQRGGGVGKPNLSRGLDHDGRYRIVMLRRHDRQLPAHSAYGAIVTGMDTSNVDTVMVAGKIVKRHGKLVGVDLARIRKEATQARDDIFAKMNWPSSVVDTTTPGR
jgi:hypothetical protein